MARLARRALGSRDLSPLAPHDEPMRLSRLLLALALAAPTLPLAACRGTYYSAMESLRGKHKRDLLVDEVEAGRTDQKEAQEQFKTTYELFQQITGYDGGDLEALYESLKDEYDDCESEAEDVSDRIHEIETVAHDMFAEWKDEIREIDNDDLRERSESMLTDTQERYDDLIVAMRGAEEKMRPVLTAFRDHVLFLKHNLNARAIASLSDVVLEIEGDVDDLIADMEASIREADEFLAAMEDG